MSTSDVSSARKHTALTTRWEAVQTAACLQPIIWCLRIYDDKIASKNRKPSNVHELARRARAEPALHPLPRRRKRALTDPLPPVEPTQTMGYNIRRSRQRTDPQDMSSFLTKLPFELRQMIYEEVLAGGGHEGCNVVHILRKQGRLGHWRCRMQHGLEFCDAKGRRCVEGWLSYRTKVWHLDRSGWLDLITDDGLLPLLQTCRLIYSEAVRVLYKKNIFHFYDPGDIRHFSRAILPQRSNDVQSIMIDWERAFSIFNPYNTIPKQDNEEWKAWRETWAIVAKMEGLKEVRVFLKSHKFIVSKIRRMKMCQPMMEIKGLRVFEIIVPFDADGDWDFASNAPFKIIKGSNRSAGKSWRLGLGRNPS